MSVIGNKASYGCTNIEVTELSTYLKYIGRYAFAGCYKADIRVTDSVMNVGEGAFGGVMYIEYHGGLNTESWGCINKN